MANLIWFFGCFFINVLHFNLTDGFFKHSVYFCEQSDACVALRSMSAILFGIDLFLILAMRQ